MTVLVHLSDPHFGTERPPIVDALVDSVRAIGPDLVVLSGDITQRATAAQFDAAAHFVRRLGPTPSLVIPGNHDIPLFDLRARLWAPYARLRQAFGDDLEPVHRSADWLVIGVKTTRRWRHKHGEVSLQQVRQVADRLREAAARQLRVVVVHQPVAVPRPRDAKDLLRGHQTAIRAWSAAGADLILGGHIHLPCVLALHERDPSLVRRTWCLLAGTAVSERVRSEAGNSFNLVHRESAEPIATIERWDYLGPGPGFQPVAREMLALDRAVSTAAGAGSRRLSTGPGDRNGSRR